MNILNFIFYCSGATSFIALPVLLINWAKYMKAQPVNRLGNVQVSGEFPIKSVCFFVIPIFVTILIANIMTTSSRVDVLKFIEGLTASSTVYVNQQPAHNPEKVVSALKGITYYMGHHSHPTKRIHIDIHSDKGDLRLVLQRDSNIPQEYWVYSPKTRVTSHNDIGRITTAVFDGY